MARARVKVAAKRPRELLRSKNLGYGNLNADQLAVAERFHENIADMWGYDNVEFRQGFIEDLEDIVDESVDVVISNCVISFQRSGNLGYGNLDELDPPLRRPG